MCNKWLKHFFELIDYFFVIKHGNKFIFGHGTFSPGYWMESTREVSPSLVALAGLGTSATRRALAPHISNGVTYFGFSRGFYNTT